MTATLKTTIIQEPSSATANIQLGTSGQVGFGGANYGTAGQVFTSGGSGAAPSWSDATVTPAGSVIAYAGSTAPSGWLLMFGQNVSRTTYAALFAVIGTTYGVGDGSTTFTLPDLRGRVVAGEDDMGGTSANRLTGLSGGVNGDILGGTGGSEVHTLTITEMPAHDHQMAFPSLSNTTQSGAGVRLTSASAANGTLTTSTGGGTAHNNVQPTIILNYIIKT